MIHPGEMTAALPEQSAPRRLSRAVNRWSAPGTLPRPLAIGHRWLYQRSDGRVGHGLIGAPVLLLHTLGRRSGKRRTSAVVYTDDRGSLAIGATNGGGPGKPAWFHNLCAEPHVEIQVGRHHMMAKAAVIDDADPDFAPLWDRLDRATNGRFDAYQARASHPIPLVVLTPDYASPSHLMDRPTRRTDSD